MYKVIIFGQKIVIDYLLERLLFEGYFVRSFTSTLDNQIIIFEGETEEPILKEGDHIFIPSLNTSAKINRVAKNVDGGYVYYTDYVVEAIDRLDVKEQLEKELQLKEEEEKRYIDKVIREKQIEEENNKTFIQKLVNWLKF